MNSHKINLNGGKIKIVKDIYFLDNNLDGKQDYIAHQDKKKYITLPEAIEGLNKFIKARSNKISNNNK